MRIEDLKNYIQSDDGKNTAYSILRIIFVLIVIKRLFGIFITPEFFAEHKFYLITISHFTLLFFLLIGFFPRSTSLLLFFLSKSFDIYYNALTLGTDLVLIVCLYLFMTLDFHKKFTIESYLGIEGRYLRFLSRLTLPKDQASFWCLFLYGILGLFAVIFHIQDEYWYHGDTVRVMLVNNYLSSFSTLFREVEARWPQSFITFSQVSVAGQTVFQLFFMPLLFFRWGRLFLFFWGVIFFLISKIFLQLSYLPDIELIFWTMIFFPNFLKSIDLRANVVRQLPVAIFGLFCILCNIDAQRTRDLGIRPYVLSAPNVFNSDDLKMGDGFPVIYCLDGEKHLIPLNNPDGSRSSLHDSDNIYFGSSLPWRRGQIGLDLKTYTSPGNRGHHIVKKFCEFLRDFNGCKKFEVQIYKNNQSARTISAEKYENHLVNTVQFEFP